MNATLNFEFFLQVISQVLIGQDKCILMDKSSSPVIKDRLNREKHGNSYNMLLVHFKHVIYYISNKYCLMMEFINSKEAVY